MTAIDDLLDPRRLSADRVERYLERNGLRARKQYSQNHLVDGFVLERIIDAADPVPGRRILEVGPGLGILTAVLLERAADVTAVEVDHRLYAHLARRFEEPATGTLDLVEADILDVPVRDLIEAPYDVVANLPYHITSPFLHHILGGEPRPDRFVLMVQREVAERIAARPGSMSYLSVFVQYHADVRVEFIVPRTAFEPPPDVDSAVLSGVTRPRQLPAHEEDSLWRLVQAGFRERRKMLHNVLPRQLPGVGRARFEEALAKARIALDRRPQTLSVDEWLELRETLGPIDD